MSSLLPRAAPPQSAFLTQIVTHSIRAILDANRNELMLLDLKFSIGTLGLAMGTFLAGLYGMNLENFIEETNWGFGAVTAGSTFFGVVVCLYGLAKLRRVQRVKMLMGGVDARHGPAATLRLGARALLGGGSGAAHHAVPSRPGVNWLREEGPTGLLDARNREQLRKLNLQKALKEDGKRRWWSRGR